MDQSIPPPPSIPHYRQEEAQQDLSTPWCRRNILYSSVYKTVDDYGPGWNEEFDSDRYQAMFHKIGYHIERNIAPGTEAFDNQVWLVTRLLPLPGEKDIQYIAKVVASRYCHNIMVIERRMGLGEGPITTTQLMKRVQRERDILCALNHDNIIKVITSFGIEDQTTQFPDIYTITIMELMEGTVDNLKEREEYLLIQKPGEPPRFRMPNSDIRDIVIQMGRALDYMHNRCAHYRVAHQAIKDENILFKQIEGQTIYKLADFEECVVYPVSEVSEQINQGIPFDYMPADARIYVMADAVPSPEYWDKERRWVTRNRQNLRTFPNDIWLLGALVANLGCGKIFDRRALGVPIALIEDIQLADFQHYEEVDRFPENKLDLLYLLNRMTDNDPVQRITSAELVQNEAFLAIEHTIFEDQVLEYKRSYEELDD